jgi:hypothetical protein
LQALDGPATLLAMRFKFDADYVVGAVMLTVLGALLVGAIVWAVSSEIAYWLDRLHGAAPSGYHAWFLLRLAGIVVLAVVLAIARLKRRKKGN